MEAVSMNKLNEDDISKKIKDLFGSDKEIVNSEPEYNFYYLIKFTLYKPIENSWRLAEEKNLVTNIKDKVNETLEWFNSPKKNFERIATLMEMDPDTKNLVLLISSVKEQKDIEILRKSGSISKYLFNNKDFHKLVIQNKENESKRNRLFSTRILEVTQSYELIREVTFSLAGKGKTNLK
jgi:hypothetical protein